MAYTTSIQWTQSTWNPITGCSMVSKGCTRCYAMILAGTRLRNHWSRKDLTIETPDGPKWTGELRFNEPWLDQPLRWRKPRHIFVCAHSDLFHEDMPADWIDMVFGVMAASPQHIFQVLTKRPERMRNYLSATRRTDWIRSLYHYCEETLSIGRKIDELIAYSTFPLPNVWVGTSVEDQKTADQRIPYLLNTPAVIRWISAEPLLAKVDLRVLHHEGVTNIDPLRGRHGLFFSGKCNRLDWVVAGGESGPGFRQMDPGWARLLRDQCHATDVCFFMKQMAGKAPIPDDLLVRQYPSPTVRPCAPATA